MKEKKRDKKYVIHNLRHVTVCVKPHFDQV